MHIYFCGIGGTGIGPLALIAKQAGYEVSGSDRQDSDYIKYLRKAGLNIHIGQTYEEIKAVHEANSIDWFVYTSALPLENPDHPELIFCKEHNIHTSKRADLINKIIEDKNLKMLAVAGTHGKSTTTAMLVWCFKQLDMPVSYSVGAKLSFGDMGEYAEGSEYFVYEADEFDRNFLEFKPAISLITGIDYDHPDIYKTREDYYQAFREFTEQSKVVFSHPEDFERIGLVRQPEALSTDSFTLVGEVNRKNAQLVVEAMQAICGKNLDELVRITNRFPGLSRRFEQVSPNIYTDYAHTPEKIRGAIQTALEVNDKLVVVYEGLHNTRQHFIQKDLPELFRGAQALYIVPSYLAREDENLEMLTPEKLADIIDVPSPVNPMHLDENLRHAIQKEADSGSLVLCLSAGGGGSLDEWLRQEFSPSHTG